MTLKEKVILNQNLSLKDLEAPILNCLKEDGYTPKTIKAMSFVFHRLLKIANEHNEIYLTPEIEKIFLEDTIDKNGNESKKRFNEHHRIIRLIHSYLQTGHASIEKYYAKKEPHITAEFAIILEEYDYKEATLGLSKSSLIKNRRPIVYLFEYFTQIGRHSIGDIQPGDTTNAIEDILTRHYSPSSFITAISGMRRLYESYPELQKYRLEIPSRIPRKCDIIEVYSPEEREKIMNCLMNSNDISWRDKAICLLSFETGIRSVDICNLKIGDVDWEHNSIHLVQSKTKVPLTLPLRSTYGNAMVNYLLYERPETKSDLFFLTSKGKKRKINITWGIVKNILKKAGISTENKLVGTRMFRHNVATTMVEKKVELSIISEELGHKSKDSTMRYISTDAKTMSTLTLPLP